MSIRWGMILKPDRKSRFLSRLSLAFVCFVAIGCKGGSFFPAEDSSARLHAQPVGTERLYRDYKQDEARADSLYRGQMLAVSGTVCGFSGRAVDHPFLLLLAPPALGVIRGGSDVLVHANLRDSEVSKASDLVDTNGVHSNFILTFLCKGSGVVKGVPRLDDCVIR